MRKNRTANLIMAALIVGILAAGILLALHISGFLTEEEGFGSQFSVKEIPGNALITSEASQNLCTITILCDTVFDHSEALDPAKIPYVPKDGTILPVTTVEFTPGETVFDVLQRVCTAAEIQLEYSWTPLYDSYYVEGINHLYEFDCGFESGWMYKVNDWFPNYGCSAYTLQGGEEIVWHYTCAGLGTDVGAKIEDTQG